MKKLFLLLLSLFFVVPAFALDIQMDTNGSASNNNNLPSITVTDFSDVNMLSIDPSVARVCISKDGNWFDGKLIQTPYTFSPTSNGVYRFHFRAGSDISESLCSLVSNAFNAIEIVVEYFPGCTDSTATNYDSTATTDDGSCTYPPNPTGSINLFDTSCNIDLTECTTFLNIDDGHIFELFWKNILMYGVFLFLIINIGRFLWSRFFV